MSFKDLKKNRSNTIDKLRQAAEKVTDTKKSNTDDRIWKPTVDKAGNGYAVIRFLPAGEGQEFPWVQYWDHGFKGPTGRWYIEKSLTSIGQSDPVSEANSELWATGRDEDKQIARERKRRLHYVSNIYVVSDPANPENEGKVMLFKYGKKIFDMINDAWTPQFQDEKPVNPFDFWEGGANFKLKIRQVDGYRNYDKSTFDDPEALFDDDDKLEEVYNQLHDLKEFTDPKNYKSYEDLKKRFEFVIGASGSASKATSAENISFDDEEQEQSAPAMKEAKAKPQKVAEPESFDSDDDDDDDDTLSYFNKLAAQG